LGIPLRIPLGPEAIGRIRAKLTSQLGEFARWELLGVRTHYHDPPFASLGAPAR
jgi:hypothetical protein